MNTGIETITSRRIWFIPDFAVWGLSSLGEHDCIAVEDVNDTITAYHASITLGDSDQQTPFASLVDHRGNRLPTTLAAPRVFVRTHGDETAFIVGRETAESFRIARSGGGPQPVTVDLLVIELGD
jgi:hypothetical protein